MYRSHIIALIFLLAPLVSFAQSPRVQVEGVEVKAFTTAPYESVKLSFNASDSMLYVLTQGGDIHRIDLETAESVVIQSSSDHGLSNIQGMDISSDGIIFIVGNTRNDQDYTNTGVIKRGVQAEGNWIWETVATTDPYPLSNTDFDHIMNEIVISPDETTLYINSGSRTDHGEEQAVWGEGLPEEGLYPGLRETPLTATILSVPADSTNLLLENDIDYLLENDFVFAQGTRNSFGLAFDGNGELFSADNAGERDDPGEFNWLRKGLHYGFPWRIGGNDTPMQFPDYDPSEDELITTEARSAIFYNDPDYPSPPEDIEFIEPILNYGPDAVNYRDPETGEIFNAAEEDTAISSFTGHRSSLGLVFDRDSVLHGEYTGDGFVLAFTGGNDPYFLLGGMEDAGEDLLHLELTKTDDTYIMSSTTIVNGFLNPIDSEMIGDKIYVLEFKNSWLNNFSTTRIWEVSFAGGTSSEPEHSLPEEFELSQNFPNPFNPGTTISYKLSRPGFVSIEVFNALGKKVKTLVRHAKNTGLHETRFDASYLSSGIYFYTLKVNGQFIQTRKMMLIK